MITSFTLRMDDKTGEITVSAPDFSKDNHMWAVQDKRVGVIPALRAARELGLDTLLIAGLEEILRRQEAIAETHQARVRSAIAAQEHADRLRAALEEAQSS